MLLLKENLETYELSLGYLRNILKKPKLHELMANNATLRLDLEKVCRQNHAIFNQYYKEYSDE